MLHTLTQGKLAKALAEAKVEAASSGKAKKLPDGGGLMLVVRPNGGSSWLLRVMRDSVRKDITLGQHPPMTLSQAREAAGQFRDKNPVTKKSNYGLDVDDTVDRLFDDWLASKTTISDIYRSNITSAFKLDVLPRFKDRRPSTITSQDINSILRAIEARDSMQVIRNVRRWLRHLFEYGVDDERRPSLTENPVREGRLRSFKEVVKGNFAAITNPAEVPALMRGIRATKSRTIRHALLLSAYTFQRPTEIREAPWSEFDLDAGLWTISAARMKKDREHWVPLAPQVVALLREQRALVPQEQPLVFPGVKVDKPLSDGTLLRRLIDLGYHRKHTPHGFRAMARTILEERLGVDARFIEKQLAHEKDALRGAYNRAQYLEERRAMMVKWADWLDQQAG